MPNENMNAPQIVAHIGRTLGLEHVPNYSVQCHYAKSMLDRGYTDRQIIDTYLNIKNERWWHDKFLTFRYLDANIETKIGKPGQEETNWDEWGQKHGGI